MEANVGALEQSVEDHERSRITALADKGPQPLVPVKPLLPEVPERAVLRQELRVLVNELARDVRSELKNLGTTIAEQEATLKTIDVPLEQVADAHERATHSFETLRADIMSLTGLVQQILTVVTGGELDDVRRQNKRLSARLDGHQFAVGESDWIRKPHCNCRHCKVG